MPRPHCTRRSVAAVAVTGAVVAGLLGASPALGSSPARSVSTVSGLGPGVQVGLGALGPASYGVLLYGVDSRTPQDAWAVGYTGDGSTDSTPVAEHWNGKKWSLSKVPGVEGATSTQLFGVDEIAKNDVWAVGSASVDGVGNFSLAEHWNGRTWKVVSTPNPPGSDVAGLSAVSAVSSDDVWAVGLALDPGSGGYLTFAEHWNGKAWSVVQTENPAGTGWAPLRGVAAVSSGDVWSVGEYQTDSFATLAEHWNGKKWTVAATPNPKRAVVSSLYAASAASSDDVWAAGCWSTEVLFCGVAGSAQRPLLEHWTGAKWKVVRARLPHGAAMGGFDAVSAESASDAWAVGTSSQDGSTATPYVVHWNGTGWQPTRTPKLDDTSPYVGGVSADSATDAWLVGATTDGGTLAEHWNGKKWTVVTTPNP